MVQTPEALKTYNKLRAPEQFRLNVWLAKHWDDIMADKKHQEQAARMATEDLMFRVTASNIRGATIGIGKRWPRGHGGNRRGTSFVSRIDLHTMATAINNLYELMDERPEQGFVDLYARMVETNPNQEVTPDEDNK